MLQTRKSRVIFVTPTTSYEINLTKDQLLAGMEIEEHIVADVVRVKYFYISVVFFCFHNLIAFICVQFDSHVGSKSRRFHGRHTFTMTCSSQKTVAS